MVKLQFHFNLIYFLLLLGADILDKTRNSPVSDQLRARLTLLSFKKKHFNRSSSTYCDPSLSYFCCFFKCSQEIRWTAHERWERPSKCQSTDGEDSNSARAKGEKLFYSKTEMWCYVDCSLVGLIVHLGSSCALCVVEGAPQVLINCSDPCFF